MLLLNRREWLLSAAAAATWRDELRSPVAAYLERHKRSEGGYGWETDVVAHTTPTFAVVGCYHALGVPVPDAARVALFLRDHYPVPERRRTERPLWRLDFEQVQGLLWMGQPVISFLQNAKAWTGPAEFTKQYELDGNPVFQHQALAVRTRYLLGLEPTEAWRGYVAARRRPNGTFHHTPASDGTDGHLLNTLWGVWASRALGLAGSPETKWVQACQTKSGGFAARPEGGVDDLAYTWAALQLAKPRDAGACLEWIASLFTEEGGFQDRPGGEPNPLATFYALDSLRLLERPWKRVAPAARARREAIPADGRVYSIQIEAPGQGSVEEAVELAGALGIHLWTAKNAQPAWLAEANALAASRKVATEFHPAGEDYGTYFTVPGHGTYSHLIDWVADVDPGPMMAKAKHKYSLKEVRDERFAALKKARGTLVWQFLENEELTRELLDGDDYDAIATFHFGNENFLHSQPYLHRWLGRKAFVGLQDAHGKESWWWGDMLAGFTTLYIASRPGWQGWLDAVKRNHVMAVRHDAVTGWRTHLAGGSPEVRGFVLKRQREWRWWDDAGRPARRPVAALTPIDGGRSLRVRLWADNNGQALPKEARTELVSLQVDGKAVTPTSHEARDDRYLLAEGLAAGEHEAVAQVRVLATGVTHAVRKTWRAV